MTIEFDQHRTGRPWTREDTRDLPDGFRYEIEDGNLIVMNSPSPGHQFVANRLMRVLDDAAEVAGLDLVAVGPVDVAVPGARGGYRSPDVAVIAGELTEGGYELLLGGDILLAVEITGKDAITRDLITKCRVYADIGIPFYWVVRIDEPEPKVVMFELDGREYTEARTVGAGESATVTEPFPVTIEPLALTRRPRA
ncbi:Uma2 family endonuclease [Sphaerisporangium corydalis]|uniref:Uma2 family endonuclease n=1 Tax=Sphaerisporangium corydalis TaxID=1441875 RepID=A0ABV9EBN6_9ACTN|nr:Uma2 family endonuclease [Sphaerisporangium corydalis]